MSAGLEKKVKEKLKLHLKALGAYFFMPVQMGMGATTVDFLCCIEGYFVGIETKAPGKTPSLRQRLTLQEIENAGGISLWGDDPSSIVSQLQAILRAKKAEHEKRPC